jgi:hypothetical protein
MRLFSDYKSKEPAPPIPQPEPFCFCHEMLIDGVRYMAFNAGCRKHNPLASRVHEPVARLGNNRVAGTTHAGHRGGEN